MDTKPADDIIRMFFVLCCTNMILAVKRTCLRKIRKT